MATSTTTTVDWIYKRNYRPGQVADLATRGRPLFHMAKKIDDFTGSAYYYSMRAGNPASVGKTFSTVQTNSGVMKGKQFAATRVKSYGDIKLDGEAIMASRDNPGAFMKLVTETTDAAIDEMCDRIAFEMYRDGKGVRGRATTIATNLLTVGTADARNFKVDMVLVVSSLSTGLSIRTGGTGQMIVTNVDEDAGTITVDDAAAYTGFTTNDYLYATTDQAACIEGLAAIIPLTAPVVGTDSFRGVDRSADANRYAGARIDDTATNIEENAGLLAVKVSSRGKKADLLLLNPLNTWVVARRLNSQVVYDTDKSSVTYGFETLMISTPAGTLKCVSDHHCPTNRGYIGKLSTLELHTLGAAPHIIADDKQQMARVYNADSVEARLRFMGNLVITDPACWGVFSI